MHWLLFCDWFISCTTRSSRFIHVVYCRISCLSKAEGYSIVYIDHAPSVRNVLCLLPASPSLLLQCPFLQEAFLYTLGWVGHFLWIHTFPFVFPMAALTSWPELPPSVTLASPWPCWAITLWLLSVHTTPPTPTPPPAPSVSLWGQGQSHLDHRCVPSLAFHKTGRKFSMCIRSLMLSSGLITHLVLNKSEKEKRSSLVVQ